MRDKVFLDTNILVYLSNPDSSFHAGICRTCARLKDRAEFWISRQVLREYGVMGLRVVRKGNSNGQVEWASSNPGYVSAIDNSKVICSNLHEFFDG